MDEEEVEFLQIPSPENIIDPVYELSEHIRCACHTLNLIGTTDATNGLKHVSRIHNSVMSKCSAFWNSSRRPKSSEIIQENLGNSVKTPCATRWNSLYDSIEQLMENKHNLNEIFKKLNISPLKENETTFLEDYLTVLKPVAMALDRLQGQNTCMYGELAPTLLAIKGKLNAIQFQESSLCKGLLTAVTCGLESRFSKILNAEDQSAVLATVSHPFFKMRWLKDTFSTKEEEILALFKRAAKEAASKSCSLEVEMASSSEQLKSEPDLFEDFFELKDNKELSEDNALELEILNYLRDPNTDLSMLNLYPNIKRVFIKYNAILPSSAPVERLFSFANLIRTPRRRALSDKLFEKLLFLKTSSV